MILFIDTETTGLVHRDLPHEHPQQPDMVQLGLVLCDDDGTERACAELIVQREGRPIPESATAVHGIDATTADRAGFRLVTVVSIFYAFRAHAAKIVAHNLDFDERVVSTAAFRAGRTPGSLPVDRACTAEMAEPVLKLPPTARMKATGYGNKHKKPSLNECHLHFFGTPVVGSHGALADARACARVYFALTRPAPKTTRPWWRFW